jgi:hypothetical protein
MGADTAQFLYLLAAVGFFGSLGGVFGLVTAAASDGAGRVAGTGLGWGVARQFSRLGEEPMSLGAQALIAGAVDGLAFGAAAGLAVGLWAVSAQGSEWARLRLCFGLGLGMTLGAILFGLAAQGLSGARLVTFVGLFAGAMAGAAVGFLLHGADGLMFGVLAGSVLGALTAFRRR